MDGITGCGGKASLWGVRRVFARISPNLPEKILGHFLCERFLMKTVLGAISSNQTALGAISSNQTALGAISSNQTALGAIFARIFKEFAQIFSDFAKVFTEFAQISLDFARIFRDIHQINILGVRLPPVPYTTGWHHSFGVTESTIQSLPLQLVFICSQ